MYKSFDAPSLSRFEPVPMKFALARTAGAAWSTDAVTGLKQRDLGIGAASNGQVVGRALKADGAGQASGWSAASEGALGLLYVTSGEIAFMDTDGTTVRLGNDDCAFQDVTSGAAGVEWSADFGGFETTTTGRGAGVAPHPTLDFSMVSLPEGARRYAPDVFKADGGPRPFFVYRDLGTTAATGGRVHIHVVRAIGQMEGGTGWHVHSMSQMFLVVAGWVDIAVDGQAPLRMVPGDAMCLANGMRHDVAGFSPDYVVFELCLPADYSTVPTIAPEDAGAAA
jgi:hypothetical protein